MDTEFLKGLGIDDDKVGSIMAEYEKEAEKHKTDSESLKTAETEIAALRKQLQTANKQIEEFRGMDIDGIKKAAEDYKIKFENAEKTAKAELEKVRFDYALDSALTGAKAKNNTAVKALLDLDGIKYKDGGLIGFAEQLEKIKSESGYLFEESTPSPAFTQKSSVTSASLDEENTLRAVMGLPAVQA